MSYVHAIMDMAYSWGGLLVAAVFWYLIDEAQKAGMFEASASTGWPKLLVYLGMCCWLLLSAAMVLLKLVTAVVYYVTSGCLL